jgi:hypothetical protein
MASVRGEQGSAPHFDTRDFAHRLEGEIVAIDVECVQASLSCIDVKSVEFASLVIPKGRVPAKNLLSAGAGTERQSIFYFAIAARKAVKYFSGNAATFICESVTMCVVSPSASSALLSARTSS